MVFGDVDRRGRLAGRSGARVDDDDDDDTLTQSCRLILQCKVGDCPIFCGILAECASANSTAPAVVSCRRCDGMRSACDSHWPISLGQGLSGLTEKLSTKGLWDFRLAVVQRNAELLRMGFNDSKLAALVAEFSCGKCGGRRDRYST